MRRLPWLCDRMLLPYRLARARASQPFVAESAVDAPVAVDDYRCDFPEGEAAFNGLGAGRDGRVYLAIGTKSTTAGRIFVFDPRTGRVDLLADLETAFPAAGGRAIPQGKIHVDFIPAGDRVYAATHVGYYDAAAATERPGRAPGFAPYSGGWFFAIAGDRVLPYAQAPAGEGVIAMCVDAGRNHAFGLTWPGGLLLSLDLASGSLRNHGPVFGAGEAGSIENGSWHRVCRCLVTHPATGHVFWSDDAGAIWRLDGERVEAVARLPVADHWRKVCWDEDRNVFVGWTWRDALLFTFDPATLVCRTLTKMSAGADRAATLAFALDPDRRRIHALVRGPGLLRQGRIQLAEAARYATYDLATGATTMRGLLQTRDGRVVTQAQSLLVIGGDAYAVAWIELSPADRTPYAQAVRAMRRDDRVCRARGYTEEIALVRFPAAAGVT